MQLIWINQGLSNVAKRIIDASNGNNLFWILYTNDVTPTHASVNTDFTLDATNFPDFTHAFSDFTISYFDSSARTFYAMAPNDIYTNVGGSSVNVYGYVIKDSDTNQILAAARFDFAPIAVIPGDNVQVVPILGDLSQA